MVRIGDTVTIVDRPHAGTWEVYSRHPQPGVVWLKPKDENARGVARHAKHGMIGISSKDLIHQPIQGDTLL